jgi:hypothetical protein
MAARVMLVQRYVMLYRVFITGTRQIDVYHDMDLDQQLSSYFITKTNMYQFRAI